MKPGYSSNFLTFLALTKRNIRILKSEFTQTIIDSVILTAINVLLFVYLFPVMGMPSALVSPVFIGSLITLFFNLSFNMAIHIVFDLKFERFIDYQMTLPFTAGWLLVSYIVAFYLELIVSTMPIIFLGLFALQSHIALNANWLLFLLMYLLIVLFFSIGSLFIGFAYRYMWYLDNVWPRRLTPLIIFGCVFVPWYRIAQISKPLSYLFLCNPITYIAEGMRTSLLSDPRYLSPVICIIAISISSLLLLVLLVDTVKKTLKPV